MAVRIFSYIAFCTIIFSIYGLFRVKDKVIILHYQLGEVSKQLIDESNRIHVLKVEQSYLTSPARLRKLSSLYLQLDTVKVKQMISDPLMPESKKYVKSHEVSGSYFNKTNVKWRYKTTANSKYIKTVSTKKSEYIR
ncbi:hypothetical protein [Candidatus Tisiphia endosymbiont of Sialis lutaria]|uniref:cell division protein FtsL n=1 Tax=Candidatus Tisiphia endosymbiont of Sialis lutaria TaxID=2029164 RepID=UPI00312C9315